MDGLTRVAALIKRFREITSGEKRSEARERAHPWKMNLTWFLLSCVTVIHTSSEAGRPKKRFLFGHLFLNMLRTAEGEGSAAV